MTKPLIILAFLALPAYAAHDPDNPKSYRDYKYEKAMEKCQEDRNRMRAQFAMGASSASAQAQNKKHVKAQFKKCTDKAESKARRRHGLER